MWQTLERKSRSITQAIPRRLATPKTDPTPARLQRGERAHHRNQDALRHAVTRNENEIATLATLIGDIDAAIARRQDTRGDKFAMTVGDRRYLKRAEAGQHLKELLEQEVAALDGLRQRSLRPGHLGGFLLTADIERALGTTSVTLAFD